VAIKKAKARSQKPEERTKRKEKRVLSEELWVKRKENRVGAN